jgi:hypothetical protein
VPSTIFDTRRFILQKLKEDNPEIEARTGSAVGTIIVKPLSFLLTPFTNEVDLFKTRLSLANVASLGPEATDEIIANYFINRRFGNLATGSARVFFADPQDATIPVNTGFISDNGLLYVAIRKITVTAGAMSINRDGSQFYVDVPVVASDFGANFNLDANRLTAAETDISGAVRITNPSPITAGLDTETDQELVDRAGLAITVRNLINKRSVQTVLLNTFNTITSITPIGYREPEMIRDLIDILTTLGPEELNIGGHADLYLEMASTISKTVDIPASSMTGELVISTNVDRGLVSESVKSGIFIDIQRGWFNNIELKEQRALELDPTSTYYVYLDANGVLQLDNVGGAFPVGSIPLSIVTTNAFKVTSVTDSRTDLITFQRPMILIESVTELDPISLTPTDRFLSNGTETLLDVSLDTEDASPDPVDSDFVITFSGDVFVSYVSGTEVYLSGYDSSGIRILDPVNVSSSPSQISRNPSVEVDSQQKIHVVYEDDTGGQFDPYHARFDQLGAVEISPAIVGTPTTGISELEMEADEADRLHLTWLEGTDVKYHKIDRDAVDAITTTTISSSTNTKAGLDIGLNGNTVTSNTDGEANGNTTFNGTFPGSVQTGQELVLTGGSLEFSAIMNATETEPPAFAATLTGTVKSVFMDTSLGSGFNTIEIALDGAAPIIVTFTSTSSNPVSSVAAEINAGMGASIATVGPLNEIVLTSTTVGFPSSQLDIVDGNDGIGFATGLSDIGGTGYDVSIISGNNALDLRVDGEDLAIVFPDIKGRLIADIINDINAISFGSPLAANIASDGGSFVRLISPGTGVDSFIEVVLGNDAIGFATLEREEGGSELGKRIGIDSVTGPTEIELVEALRTISTSPDIEYSIESVEAGMVWSEDGDVFLAKIEDTGSVFFGPANMTRIDVQTSQVSTDPQPGVNGPGVNEITFRDLSADFFVSGVVVGDTVRLTSTAPGGDEGDFIVKAVVNANELLLKGTLAGSPLTGATYEIFKTEPATNPQIDTNTDNQSQIVWVNSLKKISYMEAARDGSVTLTQRVIANRPSRILDLAESVDSSDGTHLAWIEGSSNSGDTYYMRVDEFGDVVFDPSLIKDIDDNSEDINIKVDSENRPCIIWTAVNNTSQTSRLLKVIRSAQDYFVKVNDPSCSLSLFEDSSIVFSKEFIGQPIQVAYKTSDDMLAINNFVSSEDERVFCENYKIKHTIMAVTSMSIEYTGSIDAESAQQVVIDFINGVVDGRLEASDIKNALYQAGVTFVSTPFDIKVEYFDVYGSRTNISSQNFTEIPRTARYFADTTTITLNKVTA